MFDIYNFFMFFFYAKELSFATNFDILILISLFFMS